MRTAPPGTRVRIRTRINSDPVEAAVDVRTSLLDLLREQLHLTGAKKGCDHGQCGSCTVLVDGRRVLACLTLAVTVQDREVVTVEGVADDPAYASLLDAFVEKDALQCGYCTPGQVCSAVGMRREAAEGWPSAVAPDLEEVRLDPEEVRERMSGNLCRCGAYLNLIEAILGQTG